MTVSGLQIFGGLLCILGIGALILGFIGRPDLTVGTSDTAFVVEIVGKTAVIGLIGTALAVCGTIIVMAEHIRSNLEEKLQK